MEWLQKRCETATAERDVMIMYTVDGLDHLPEMTLDHLDGYNGAKPVRIGNGAIGQRQLDVYGEIMDSVYLDNKEVPESQPSSDHVPTCWPVAATMREELQPVVARSGGGCAASARPRARCPARWHIRLGEQAGIPGDCPPSCIPWPTSDAGNEGRPRCARRPDSRDPRAPRDAATRREPS